MAKRVFLIVLDSFGIGEMPDSYMWNDLGSNTLGAIRKDEGFFCPNLKNMGLFNIDGIGGGVESPIASFAKMAEQSNGKDTTVGHWEIAGVVSKTPLPTYPQGFPDSVIQKFEKATGKKVLCNKPYSGTEVIKDYGEQHLRTGDLIVYTSQDSVFQIACHKDVATVEELYRYCQIAREMLVGEHGVGRVIARPFEGEYPFIRSPQRHDYSLEPTGVTALDVLKDGGYDVIGVGKIGDIFAGRGVTESYPTKSNADGIDKTLSLINRDFCGLCFVNLVDFDSVYGHRNDVSGYAKALSYFDLKLKEIISVLKKDDVLIITADHGCDPSTPSTDHSREYTPMIVFGDLIKAGINLGTRESFADIGATVLSYFGLPTQKIAGKSFLQQILK